MTILAIDPGPTASGFVYLAHDGHVEYVGKVPNAELLERCRCAQEDSIEAVAIEWITVASVAGAEVYQTCRWVGRFEEASPVPVGLVPRMDVLLHLFGRRNVAKADVLVRRAMLDRYGGDGAKGTKREPGPLYGFHADCWAALAVAVTFLDLHGPNGGTE